MTWGLWPAPWGFVLWRDTGASALYIWLNVHSFLLLCVGLSRGSGGTLGASAVWYLTAYTFGSSLAWVNLAGPWRATGASAVLYLAEYALRFFFGAGVSRGTLAGP